METFVERWDRKYPKIVRPCRDNRFNLSTYFKYPQEVRHLIRTTNAIVEFNHQLRKVTKVKSVFPTDESLLKMLYPAMIDKTKNGRDGGRTGPQSTRDVGIFRGADAGVTEITQPAGI